MIVQWVTNNSSREIYAAPTWRSSIWRVQSTHLDVTGATAHAIATEYPQSILRAPQICSSHSGTVLHETYIAGQEESRFYKFRCIMKMITAALQRYFTPVFMRDAISLTMYLIGSKLDNRDFAFFFVWTNETSASSQFAQLFSLAKTLQRSGT